MSVRKRWQQVFKIGGGPLSAFEKDSATCFTRRRGSATQRVAFRASIRNAATTGTWFLDAGCNLDEIVALDASTTGQIVVGGLAMWMSPDLGELGITRDWEIEASTDLDAVAIRLHDHLTRLVAFLDPLDGPRAVLERVDLSAGFNKLQRAQLSFVLGDRSAALADVHAVCAEFSDRRGMALDDVLEREGLGALRS